MIRDARTLICLGALLALLLPLPTLAQDFGWLWASTECLEEGTSVRWTFEDAGGAPDAVAFDVFRRETATCGPVIRLTENPFPRGERDYAFLDETAVPSITYRYTVEFVNSDREVVPPPADPLQCSPCVQSDWTACPDDSAPITHGVLTEFSVFIEVTPCEDTCHPAILLEPPYPSGLEDLVDTGIAVKLFGDLGCGTIEGCILVVDHYEVAPCAASPVEPSTWGRVKATYR